MNQTTPDIYKADFTATGLLYEETLRLLPTLMKDDAIDLLRIEESQNEYLLISSQSSRKRIGQEIRKRSGVAPDGFWEYFEQSGEAEQKILLFYLCLKAYPLMFDLHFSLTVSRWKRLNYVLTKHDVLFRFDLMTGNHPEMNEWTDTTLDKLATNYLRMLREANLLAGNELKPALTDPNLWKTVSNWGDNWLHEAAFAGSTDATT
jgi:hypothetical protein